MARHGCCSTSRRWPPDMASELFSPITYTRFVGTEIRSKLTTTLATTVYQNQTESPSAGEILILTNTSADTVDITVTHYVNATTTAYAFRSGYPLFAHETETID